jgi:hypothetical protein
MYPKIIESKNLKRVIADGRTPTLIRTTFFVNNTILFSIQHGNEYRLVSSKFLFVNRDMNFSFENRITKSSIVLYRNMRFKLGCF